MVMMNPLLLDGIAVAATLVAFLVLIAFSEGCEHL
jgi:hypothetical protein